MIRFEWDAWMHGCMELGIRRIWEWIFVGVASR